MSQRGLKSGISTSGCQLYTYPVHLNASSYLPDQGYPIQTKAKYENRLVNLFHQAVPLVFDLLNNLFITYLSMMHHSHLRPTNYSNVLMETRIRQNERQRRYYRDEIIKPRRGKIYYPRDDVRNGHQEELKGNAANAWLVTFQTPDEVERNGGKFNRDQAMICFTENDAIQLNKNARTLAKKCGSDVFFDLNATLSKNKYQELYAEHPVDDVYNMKLKKLAELKKDIAEKLQSPGAGAAEKKGFLRGLWERLIPRNLLAWDNLHYQANLRKYVMVEASNPKRDASLFKKAVAYQMLNAEIYQRYLHNKTDALAIAQMKVKLDEVRLSLLNKANAYLQSHLQKYIDDKFGLMNVQGARANISTLTLLKMKLALLGDLRKLDYIKVYRDLPKKPGLFDVDFSHFNEVIDHQLARGDVPAYIDNIRMAHSN